jgi:hypothetical protein
MQDKRKLKRRYLLYYMRIYEGVSRQQIGNLVDITPKGIMIVGDHPIPEGQIAHLRMELTNEVADKPFMEISAISKWCEPDVTPDRYNTGFEIQNLAPEDVEIIQRINEGFGFRDNILEKRPVHPSERKEFQ